MKKWICLFLGILLLAGSAWADQSVALPGNRYTLDLPDEMEYSPRNPRDVEQSAYFQFAYFSKVLELEMDVFAYANGGVSLQDLCEAMASKGETVEIRRINGLDLLCYTGQDDPVQSDGAYYSGYVLMDGDQAIEITFWYATQQGADLITEIMSGIR